MIYPALSDLLKSVNSRYSLVIGTAKRAREIADGDKPLVPANSDKHVTIAIQEIIEGKVAFKTHDDLYDIYDEKAETPISSESHNSMQ